MTNFSTVLLVESTTRRDGLKSSGIIFLLGGFEPFAKSSDVNSVGEPLLIFQYMCQAKSFTVHHWPYPSTVGAPYIQAFGLRNNPSSNSAAFTKYCIEIYQSRSKTFECRLYDHTDYNSKLGVELRNDALEFDRLKGYVGDLMDMHNLLSRYWGRKLDSPRKNPGMDFHVQLMRLQKEVLQRKIQRSIDELKEFFHCVLYGT